MKRQVLPQARVREALEPFVKVELSIRRHSAIAGRYGVIGSPTLVALDSDGNVVSMLPGGRSAEEVIRFAQHVSGPVAIGAR